MLRTPRVSWAVGAVFFIQDKKAAGFSGAPYSYCRPVGMKAAYSSRNPGTGAIACSVEAIRPSRDLEGEPEPDIVVAVVRIVVVAIGCAAVLRIVVPVAAAQNAVRTLWQLPIN